MVSLKDNLTSCIIVIELKFIITKTYYRKVEVHHN